MDTYEWFWEKVDVRGPDECWPWTKGTAGRMGYGQGTFPGSRRRRFYAHRLSFIIANGPIPDERIVCHHCDNPPCVNPAHLYAGTHQTNSDDKWTRNRAKTALGTSRPDVTIRNRQALVARQGGVWADPEDWQWWMHEDFESGLQAARGHVERVIRGDGLDTNCRWLSLDA